MGEQKESKEIDLIAGIKTRAGNASARVKERVEGIIKRLEGGDIVKLGGSKQEDVAYDLAQMESDFSNEDLLAEAYKGWSSEEIKEIYTVLFDRDKEELSLDNL